MRPLTLTFCGLRSYRHRADIDFTDLDCFAIIGDTGAGKSTILEALSIALYGRKTWSSNQTTQEAMIADGADQMTVELVFETDGQVWTVSRVWKRSTAPNINKLVGPDDQKYDGGDVTKRVTELIGLDHNQFTRAVVLPQGRFDELLCQSPADRNRTLKSLLGAGELDAVTRAAKSAKARWHDQTVAAEAARRGLPADPAAEITAAEELLAQQTEIVEALDTAVTSATAHQTVLDEAASVIETLTDPVTTATGWDPTPTVGSLTTRATEATDAQTRHRDLSNQRDDASSTESNHRAQAALLLGPFADRDAAVTASTTLRDLAGRLASLTADNDSAQTTVEHLEKAPPTKTIDPDLVETASDTRTAAQQAKALADEAAAASAEAARLGTAADQASKEAATKAADASRASLAADEARSTMEQAEAAVIGAQDTLRTAVHQLQVAQTHHHAAMAAETSAAGDPCPICDRALPENWDAPTPGPLVDSKAAVSTAETNLSAARRHHNDATSKVAAADETARLSAKAAQTAAVQAQQARDLAESAGVDWTATIPTAPAEAAADSAARQASEAEQIAELADAAVDEARGQALAEYARWEAKLDSARTIAATAERALAEAVRSADHVPEPWQPTAATPDAWTQAADNLDSMLARHLESTQAADASAAIAASLSSELTELNDVVTGTIVAPARAEAATLVHWRNTVSMLDPTAAIPKLPALNRFDDLTAVAEAATAIVTAAKPVITAAQKQLQRSRQAAEAAKTAILDALADTGTATVASARESRSAARERQRTASENLAATEAIAAEAQAIDAYLVEARPYLAALDVINATLRDGRFVDYVIGGRERELLSEASRRLRAISNNHHAFTEDFAVINLNSGEARPAEALSGGERFQASLALALALVEIASRGAGQLGAIFVDEGFGSLGAGALESALDTLVTIAGHGKQVGLISHLRSVAAAVEDVFHVHKDPTTGSRIEQLDVEDRDELLADGAVQLL